MATPATSIGRSTGTQAIIIWLNRNGVSTGPNTPADAWRNYLQGQIGSSGQDGKRDLERTWLRMRIVALGGTPVADGLADLWGQYLGLKGFSTGNLDDQFIQWIDHGTA